MATENIIPELSWLCALLFLMIVIMLVLTCVCFKEGEKPQEYGTAGRLSITRDSPILHFQPRNGGTHSICSRHSDLSSDDGNPKRNSWTVKDRALPEIPDSVTGSNNKPENGIPVGNITVANEQVKVKSRNKAMAPKPPGSDPSKVFPLNGSALIPPENASSAHTVMITVNDKTHIIGNNTSSLDLGAKTRIPIVDSVPGTSASMVVLKKVEKKESSEPPSESSDLSANVYDVVGANISDRCLQTRSVSSSPACIKVENSEVIAMPDEENVSSPPASLAVAGAVPSSDIPYMTPPLIHNGPSSSYEISEENNAGGRSEVPYTVISVREPLARVREMTMRKQRAVAVQQNSEDSEDHYAMVPEEEQMYAEIGSGQDSGSSSITYAHIEPRELPPVPPTVESLKSVAHAHSRQASTVSSCSFTSNVSSSGEPASPSTIGNHPTSLYSTVEKNNKQRKTIHLGEGVSLVTTTAEKRKKVEDLYAKVRKKRVDLTISTSGSEDYSSYQGMHGENMGCITPPPSPWASTTPPAPPPIAGRLQAATLSVLLPGSSHHVRRHSADPNLPEVITDNRVFSNSPRSSLVMSNTSEEPDYERIYNEENNSGDSCYEKIKDEAMADGSQSKVIYGSSHLSDAIPSESNYPGYESVKDEDEDSADPGYECVAQGGRENDPGYEPVRVLGSFEDSDSNSDYTVVKHDEIREPGYEIVKNLARSSSDAADPGYEKIKKVPRTDSDATDPGYERVKNKTVDVADPGYETVQRSDSDTDPCYEIVHGNNETSLEYAEGNSSNSSTVTHNSKSTVLFVSGNSEIHSNHNSDSHTRRPTIISESSLTFL